MGRQASYEIPNYSGTEWGANMKIEESMRIIDEEKTADAANLLLHATTVDSVEVVRCKDCKWYMPGEIFTDIMFCYRLKKENGKSAKYNFREDDFCSYGERRADG